MKSSASFKEDMTVQAVFRDIEVSDFSTILKINLESIPGVAELDSKDLAYLLDRCGYSRAIEINSEIIGYLLAIRKGREYDGEEYQWFSEHVHEDFLYIDQVAVSERFRGMGIGKMLYSDLIRYAEAHGVSLLTCEVNQEPLNKVSMGFHRNMDFHELSRMATRGIVVSLLVKRLK